MAEGYIYILLNRAFQNDLHKIGMTTKTPEERARETSNATGVPRAPDQWLRLQSRSLSESAGNQSIRYALSRPSTSCIRQKWMPGIKPGMTVRVEGHTP